MSSFHDSALLKILQQLGIFLERANKLILCEMEKRGIADKTEDD